MPRRPSPQPGPGSTSYLDRVRWVEVSNENAEDAPGGALLMVTGGGTDDGDSADDYGVPTVDQPDADGLTGLLVAHPAGIPAGGRGLATSDDFVPVAYDDADTPAVGETWGSAAGSWLLTKDMAGWRVAAPAVASQDLKLVECWRRAEVTSTSPDWVEVVLTGNVALAFEGSAATTVLTATAPSDGDYWCGYVLTTELIAYKHTCVISYLDTTGTGGTDGLGRAKSNYHDPIWASTFPGDPGTLDTVSAWRVIRMDEGETVTLKAITSNVVGIAPTRAMALGTDSYAPLGDTRLTLMRMAPVAGGNGGSWLTDGGEETSPPPPPPPPPPGYSISGVVSSGPPGYTTAEVGRTLTLSGANTATTTTDAGGAYTFGSLSAGITDVDLDPAGLSASEYYIDGGGILSGYTATVIVAGSHAVTWRVTVSTDGVLSGTVTDSLGVTPLSGRVVTLSGTNTATATTDGSGNYSFSALTYGSTTATLTLSGGESAQYSLDGGAWTSGAAPVVSVDASTDLDFRVTAALESLPPP